VGFLRCQGLKRYLAEAGDPRSLSPQIAEHLSVCSGCRALWAELADVDRRLESAAARHGAPPTLDDVSRRRMRSHVGSAIAGAPPVRYGPQRWLVTAGAAAIVMIGLIVAGRLRPGPDRRPNRMARRTMDTSQQWRERARAAGPLIDKHYSPDRSPSIPRDDRHVRVAASPDAERPPRALAIAPSRPPRPRCGAAAEPAFIATARSA